MIHFFPDPSSNELTQSTVSEMHAVPAPLSKKPVMQLAVVGTHFLPEPSLKPTLQLSVDEIH